ncbi:hypothetical protein [Candidatus Albibeggiatoa sp. nov. BB20]|uniref:hypothetical protein n=1 Tax=Candidatus Albibeggiatoa sp. nov. BB20 TaxID=3162723 RepID=UPI00336581F2
MEITPHYIVNNLNDKIAVQLDIKTFNKIEQVLENYALYHLIQEYEDDEILDMDAAKTYYATLEKN